MYDIDDTITQLIRQMTRLEEALQQAQPGSVAERRAAAKLKVKARRANLLLDARDEIRKESLGL